MPTMKLFCNYALRRKMCWKTCEKAATPSDPLDGWYASLVQYNGTDILVVMLPASQFCVFFWDVEEIDRRNIRQRLVKGIRAALDDPFYRIPLCLINQYMPADTVLEPCTPDQDYAADVRLFLNDILMTVSSFPVDRWNGTGSAAARARAAHFINNRSAPLSGYPGFVPSWRAVRTQLQRRYGKAAPAIEMEISLDGERYDARRTLIVSADTSFYLLSAYVHAALRWNYGNQHQFVLPPVLDGTGQTYLLGDGMDVLALPPDTPWLWDREPRLGDLLHEGTVFQYQYSVFDDFAPWDIRIQVKRCLPEYTEEVPVCTHCQGIVPSDLMAGEDGYWRYLQCLRDADDPKYTPDWVHGDTAAAITERLDTMIRWLFDNVDAKR